MTSSALLYAEEGEWEDLLEEIDDNPAAVSEKDDFGMLPLHWVCTEERVPLNVIKQLVRAYPESCRYRNSSGMLPLHIAIKTKLSIKHINVLLKASPDTIYEPNAQQKLPYEQAKEQSMSKEMVELLSIPDTSSCDSGSRSSRCSSSSATSCDIRASDLSRPILMESNAELSHQLKDILGELRQISNGIHRTSRGSVVEIFWDPLNTLGISFEAYSGKDGAKVKRFTGKGTVSGLGNIQIGDVLLSINGKPLIEVPFKNIVKYLKVVKDTSKLEFLKPEKNSYMAQAQIPCSEPVSSQPSLPLMSPMDEPQYPTEDRLGYLRMTELLNRTMSKIETIEDCVMRQLSYSV